MIKKYMNYYDIDYSGGSFVISDEDLGLKSKPFDYKDNIFPVKKISIDNQEYDLYLARFNNIYDLYDFLKSNPPINEKVFTDPSSYNAPKSFAGLEYPLALEELVKHDNSFVSLDLKIKDGYLGERGLSKSYEKYLTPVHGKLIVPAYGMGKPNCYQSVRRKIEHKYINVYISLAYLADVLEEQVTNRAIIIANILKSLEEMGYVINLNTFELSSLHNEIAYIVVGLKNYSDKLDINLLYKVLCNIHFRRRILFRVLESLKVTHDVWGISYGRTCNGDFTKKFLNLKEDDIYFGTPSEMNIKGDNLEEDYDNAIKYLGLEEIFMINEDKKKIRSK